MTPRFNLLITVFLAALFSSEPAVSQTIPDTPTADQQITAATSAAPQQMRDDATVLGYSHQMEIILLREGTNEITCLADTPGDDRFHVACYHNDLEPFMTRGRELKSDGYTTEEIREIRQQEIENGILSMPDKTMSLYSLTGSADAWDYETGTLQAARPLYVVYVPYATVESTGIAPSPVSEGAPWLMDPGKPWAHIMIGTGRTLGEAAGQ